MTGTPDAPVQVAALQYCAAGTAAETLPFLLPMITRAAKDGATLVCLPEAASFLAANRASLREEAETEGNSPTLDQLCHHAAGHGIAILAGSLMMRRREDDALVNRTVLIDANGVVCAHYDKIHMFDANVGDGHRYRESDSFAAGNRMVLADMAGMTIGLSICYDLRFPGLYRGLARAGARMLSIPAAFTFPSGKAHWHVLLRARAIETGCFVVAPAQCGTHADGRRTYGHAMIVSPWGEILAEVPTDDTDAAAGANDGIIHATLDPAAVAAARNAIPSLASNPDFS